MVLDSRVSALPEPSPTRDRLQRCWWWRLLSVQLRRFDVAPASAVGSLSKGGNELVCNGGSDAVESVGDGTGVESLDMDMTETVELAGENAGSSSSTPV